jgi:hypothetical protein
MSDIPVYLVELFDPWSGDALEVDLYARLDTAVESVYLHLKKVGFTGGANVDVSFDDESTIEGVGFFNENQDLISCVTAYHLSRDTAVPQLTEIKKAFAAEPSELQSLLNTLFQVTA